MGRATTEGMLEHAEFDVALRHHLFHNHYPRLPEGMFNVAKMALEAYPDNLDMEIILPDGMRDARSGLDGMSAYRIIEALHLDAFLTYIDPSIMEEDYEF
jgi:hypothetical protein